MSDPRERVVCLSSRVCGEGDGDRNARRQGQAWRVWRDGEGRWRDDGDGEEQSNLIICIQRTTLSLAVLCCCCCRTTMMSLDLDDGDAGRRL